MRRSSRSVGSPWGREEARPASDAADRAEVKPTTILGEGSILGEGCRNGTPRLSPRAWVPPANLSSAVVQGRRPLKGAGCGDDPGTIASELPTG